MKKYTIIILLLFISKILAQNNVSFDIDLTKPFKPISPYIYGTNNELTGTENWTAFRQGGNRMTGYNWENNASHAGADWYNNNDNYLPWVMGISVDKEDIPAIVTTTFHNNSKKYNAYSLITLQMAGYVAKDKSGTSVSAAETAPSSRWIEVQTQKGSSLSLSPDLNDNYEFIDEYVNFLVSNLGNSSSGGIKGYSLDNEPALWPSTHPRIHPDKTRCKEIVDNGIATSKAVKSIDTTAEVFGPALYGFGAFTNFQDAPDWSTVSRNKGYKWFIDYYLDEMKKAESNEGKRLLDVLDVHWYPEAQGDHRITAQDATTEADNLARLQAPRTLWDKKYIEKSWIGQWNQSYLPIIPGLLASINKYYPGTKLAITEFTYGGENHISGAIATADVLGIFAKYGVYFGSLWPVQDNRSYLSAAYKIYRNYDGSNSTFGDYYASSKTSDSVNTSIYASINTSENQVHIIAINKNFSSSRTANISLNYDGSISLGKVWYIDSSSAGIKQGADITDFSNNSFTYTLPAGSVSHIVLQTSTILSVENNKNIPEDFRISTYPNPFNASCKIEYNVGGNNLGYIEIFDIMGRRIKSYQVRGSGSLTWDGKNESNITVSSGTYLIVLRGSEQKSLTRKVMLLK